LFKLQGCIFFYNLPWGEKNQKVLGQGRNSKKSEEERKRKKEKKRGREKKGKSKREMKRKEGLYVEPLTMHSQVSCLTWWDPSDWNAACVVFKKA
jgi:hypothetical protein